MTMEEKEMLYRILFEDSDEEPTDAVYEVYDTITDLFDMAIDLSAKKLFLPQLPQINKILH